ncbi:unnamed protein product [Sphenostylis stenocarpa]|uniref:Uncharacterized protein n=1 Tax=Sphenostylis stenocarpa TaxID=92480 RepID=A0AA86VZ51_9FABA|nr:unnamed protein product [Sphenostylis stenocarpa]
MVSVGSQSRKVQRLVNYMNLDFFLSVWSPLIQSGFDSRIRLVLFWVWFAGFDSGLYSMLSSRIGPDSTHTPETNTNNNLFVSHIFLRPIFFTSLPNILSAMDKYFGRKNDYTDAYFEGIIRASHHFFSEMLSMLE